MIRSAKWDSNVKKARVCFCSLITEPGDRPKRMLPPSDKGRERLNLRWLVEEGDTAPPSPSPAPLPFQLKEDIIMSK